MPELDGPPKTAVKDWHAGTLQDAAEGFMVTAEEPHVPLQAPLTIQQYRMPCCVRVEVATLYCCMVVVVRDGHEPMNETPPPSSLLPPMHMPAG